MGTKRKKTGRGPAITRSAAGTTALLLGFERWYTRHVSETDHEHPRAQDAAASLARLFALSAGRLSTPTVAVLESLLAEVEADPSLAAQLPDVIELLEHYLDFAVSTGTWNGTEAQIDESSEFLEVAFDVATGLLLYLLDALDDVADVAPAQERAALGALASPARTAEEFVAYLRDVLATGDPASVPGALALERVLGLLSVAASPGLLPGASSRQISGMLDTAAGVTAEQASAAEPETSRLLTVFETDGVVVALPGMGGVRFEAPSGLRAALADAVMIVADELGLLEDDSDNPHPEGTVLEVKAAVVGSKPASWRRLLLAADSDLGELHLALQLSLDWANEEVHSFSVADEPDVVFTAIDRLDDEAEPAEGSEDEADVELGELLIDQGDEVEYRYGGDSDEARVVIRLENVLESFDRSLPRVSGASAGLDVAEIDGLLSPLRLR